MVPGTQCILHLFCRQATHPHPQLHFNSLSAPVIPLPYCFPTAMPSLSARVIIQNATIKLYVTCMRSFLLPALNLPGTPVTVSAHFIIIYKAYTSDFDSSIPPLKLSSLWRALNTTVPHSSPLATPLMPGTFHCPLLFLRPSMLCFLTSFSFSHFRSDLSQKQSPHFCEFPLHHSIWHYHI